MEIFRFRRCFGIACCLSTLLITSCSKNDVVVDSDTGLMWQDDESAGSLKKHWLAKEMYDSERYYDTSGDTADSYCKKLNLAGYKDWRLPTEKELWSTLKESRDNPGSVPIFKNVAPGFYWSSITPTGDDAISISINDQKMDSTSVITINGEPVSADNNPFAFTARGVFYSDGNKGAADKYSLANVRCVRKSTK